MALNNWSKLNRFQLGKYGEYFAKMEFTKAGFDVYTAEVDDKGIDFVVRKNKLEYFDIQVKSVRNNNYIFIRKKVFIPRRNLFLVLILFEENKEPTLLLVPSLNWQNKAHSFLVERNYEGKKSKPEWGISVTKSNIEEIKSIYAFDQQITFL
ncbi:DUF4365 domain-containing protein [bacterium]|nr:DUF4365 domain-containing protein [bacterium]